MLRVFVPVTIPSDMPLTICKIYCTGHHFRAGDAGHERLHHCPGVHGGGHEDGAYRRRLNTVLDPIFIFAFNMGVGGAALATILSPSGQRSVGAPFPHRSQDQVAPAGRKPAAPCQGGAAQPGAGHVPPPFIMQATESLIAVCFNSSLLKYGGDIAVGAMTVLTSIMQFAMMPLRG